MNYTSQINDAIIQIKHRDPQLGWKSVARIVCKQMPATPNMIRKRYRRLVKQGVISPGPQRTTTLQTQAGRGTTGGLGQGIAAPVESPSPSNPGQFQACADEDLFGDDGEFGCTGEGSVNYHVASARQRIETREVRRLRQLVARLGEARAVEDRLVSQFRSSLQPFTPQVRPLPLIAGDTNHSVGEPEAAILLLSDAHIGQYVDPGQTRGAGRYGPGVYLDRLAYLEAQVSAQVQATGVREVHVFLLGDVVHGRLDHGAEAERTALLTDQVRLAAWSLGQFLLRLATLVPLLHVHVAGGNHARWMDQRRVPTVNRHSNLDHVVYGCVQAILWAAGAANVRFALDAELVQVVDVLGVRIAARHGDQIRGGDKLGGTATASLARDVAAVSAMFGALGERAPDYYVIGDKHRHLVMSLPTGEFLVNGSFVGVDEYSFGAGFAPARPMQIMFGLNRHGKTWQRDISLRLAPAGGGVAAYELPADLRAVI